jgi:uridine phosphorylase
MKKDNEKQEIQMEKVLRYAELDEKELPLMEFDPDYKSITKPKTDYDVSHKVDRCLFTYFQDVIGVYERNYLVNQVFLMRTEGVRPRVLEMKVGNEYIYVVPVPAGAPQAARMLEQMAALGIKKFMVCGGAGSLDEEVTNNRILLPTSAVRDEGTSYHYLPPSRTVEINPIVQKKIEKVLTASGEAFRNVKTWTTDASFRETPSKVMLRKREGCSVVEMECAAYYAVAQFKRLQCGQLLYAGDLVKPDGWEYRNWHNKTDEREKLFNLSVQCLMEL